MEEFIGRSGAKAVFYVASQLDADAEFEQFRQAVATSATESAAIAAESSLGSWQAALTLLANEATKQEPIVIVLDEFPYLVGAYPPIEGVLQTIWDRTLEHKAPVMLILVGSDITMMESLATHGRPLFNRPAELVVNPLSPSELASMLSLDAVTALEAYLVIGGYPRLAARWRAHDNIFKFIERELRDPESPLIVLGERMLTAEFPADLKAQSVLRAIGAGERTFKGINQQANAGVSSTLAVALETMQNAKRVVVKARPYSAEPRPKLTHYSIADPYLRFWLRFIEGQQTTVQRGRGDVALARIKKDWLPYQGRAVEPIIRSAIERLLPDEKRFSDALFVGGYWNRDSSIEVDLVGGQAPDKADPVSFVGSIKWLGNKPFDKWDLNALLKHRTHTPGADANTRLVGVSRTGFDVTGLDVHLTAEDILAAYR